MPLRETRTLAASRGALLAVLTSALILSLALAWVSASGDRRKGSGAFEVADIPDFLLFRSPGTSLASSLVWPGLLYAAGAAVAGLLTGLVAWRLRGTVRRRVAILLALSPLGPWLLAAVVVTVPPLSSLHVRDLGDAKILGFVASMPLWSLLFSASYVLLLAPLVAPPVILGHLLLEGWTRPAELPQDGFARPGVRAVVLQVLVGLTAACAAFALLRAAG